MSQTVIPQLRMTQATISLPFYLDGLGFRIDWQHQFEPGFPLFVQISRNGQTLFLTEHAGDCQVGGAAYFIIPNVDELYQECIARGVIHMVAPRDTPWGTRELLIIDPDGNNLRFAVHFAS